MNIFFLNEDPILAAQDLVDRHVVKMITESNQMLSTAHHLCPSSDYGSIKDQIYKKTHANHPSAKWIRECSMNYSWTIIHTKALCKEYTRRYGRRHAGEDKVDLLAQYMPDIPTTSSCTLAPCAMEDQYKVFPSPKSMDEVIVNYRNYYAKGKSHLHNWKNKVKPAWLYN
jgi:hypothetical protein